MRVVGYRRMPVNELKKLSRWMLGLPSAVIVPDWADVWSAASTAEVSGSTDESWPLFAARLVSPTSGMVHVVPLQVTMPDDARVEFHVKLPALALAVSIVRVRDTLPGCRDSS